MEVLRTIADMRLARKAVRSGALYHGVGDGEVTRTGTARQPTLALVPTMGALHEGHLSLVRAARASCDCVAASIFVNPLQFGPNEDLDRYPRTFERDRAMLSDEGVDLLFAPGAGEMYPPGMQSWADVPHVGARLDGASRPGHFRGVATVVTKLFHVVQPDLAFFGQKDAAQVAVLRTMLRDLNFDLEIVVCPTVRDPDGLALSSRNVHLSAAERAHALALSRSLCHLQGAAANGQVAAQPLRDGLLQELRSAAGLRLDYAEIVNPDTLEPVSDVAAGALVAVAAWVGNTRLIDNIILPPRATDPPQARAREGQAPDKPGSKASGPALSAPEPAL